MTNLEDYRSVTDGDMERLFELAKPLQNKHIVGINSTYQGGGVAEMLNSCMPLFNQLGIDFGWRVLHGNADFFSITKKFHNALQGNSFEFSKREQEVYYQTNKRFASFTHLNHDLVIVHDPQPLSLIDFYPKQQPWIWRAHIDLLQPNPDAWDYLKGFIEKYDHAVVSNQQYKQQLATPQSIIYPAIDPLTDKNRPMQQNEIKQVLAEHNILLDKPIITQISRFDKWKDPLGVIEIFKLVKQEVDCQLVLMGNLATDDPEGPLIYEQVLSQIEDQDLQDVHILMNVEDNDRTVNALQRAADVVIQKSLREGFGLTVTEAMYKGTPVAASQVGGIPTQIKHTQNGYLHQAEDIKSFADTVVKLLQDRQLRTQVGQAAHQTVKNKFMITRLMADWLELLNQYVG